jgi:hypothetical protein
VIEPEQQRPARTKILVAIGASGGGRTIGISHLLHGLPAFPQAVEMVVLDKISRKEPLDDDKATGKNSVPNFYQ